jgi:hypothetical protein
MNTTLLRLRDCLFNFHDRMSTNVGDALSVGTTLTTRLWVGLFSLSLATQIGFSQPSLFSHVGLATFFALVPATWWGLALTASGLLMLWRTVARKPRPWIAWISNCLAFGLWSSIVLIRFVLIGSASLASTATIIALMSGWLVLRTEATARDKETA